MHNQLKFIRNATIIINDNNEVIAFGYNPLSFDERERRWTSSNSIIKDICEKSCYNLNNPFHRKHFEEVLLNEIQEKLSINANKE